MTGGGRQCLLRIDDLTVGTGGVMLLRGLSLRLGDSELVALAGPSGCGKTTLLRTISGLIDPLKGSVTLDGEDSCSFDPPCFRRRVVLVDQRPVLLEGSVEHNLRRPFDYRSGDGTAFPARDAAELLDQFGVGAHRMSQEARSLSMGQQQRVCLVRALLTSPSVLLLDEPTSALDRDAVESVERKISGETHRRGLSALVVTHDMEQARRLCDRVIDLGGYVAGEAERAG